MDLTEAEAEKPAFDRSPYVKRIRDVFIREQSNPILAPEAMPFPCKAVCNPGAVEFEGDVLLLLRIIDENDRSRLVVARSKDGVKDWRVEAEPLLKGEEWYDEWGCEDPRITYLADRGEYVIVYVGYSHFGAGVCLATTKDFKTVARLGMVLHPYNKDAALFPERIAGKYRLLHRPTMSRLEDVWISESDDLLHWGTPYNVLEESDRPGWEGGKIGAGPPPFMGGQDWVLMYHGVERKDERWTYRVGIVTLHKDAPQNVVRAWPEWVFGPQESYEFDDKGQGIVFPTGLIERGGKLMMYYGAGDRSVGLAVADLEALRQIGHEFLQASEPDREENVEFHDNGPGDRV